MASNFLNVYLISDSTGETADVFINSVIKHFPNTKIEIIRKPDIDSKEKFDQIIENIDKNSSVVIQTIADKDLAAYASGKTKKENIKSLDILSFAIDYFEEVIGQKALREEKLSRQLSKDYFSMIDSVEFAVKYDDGKDPRGILESDIVLVGISRTSKTPLSMLLATKGFKVSNLPLVPEIMLPREIFEIDSKRIIGLTINSDQISKMREKRSKILGLDSNSAYDKEDRISKELEYAKEVFENLECKVIDVSSNTIEQTATEIINYYRENF
jgi:regulator of PEP synthase PpsR (kinase-PPPase family)